MNIADSFQLKPKDINHTYEHSLEFSIDDNIICLVTKLSSTKLAGYYILLVQLTVQADSNIYNKMGGSQAWSNQSLNNHNYFGLSQHITTHSTHTKCMPKQNSSEHRSASYQHVKLPLEPPTWTKWKCKLLKNNALNKVACYIGIAIKNQDTLLALE